MTKPPREAGLFIFLYKELIMPLKKMIESEHWLVLDTLADAMIYDDIDKIKSILANDSIPREHKATGLEMIYRIHDRYDYAIPLFKDYITVEYIGKFIYLLFETNAPYYLKKVFYNNIKSLIEASSFQDSMEYNGDYDFNNIDNYYTQLLETPALIDHFIEYLIVNIEEQIENHEYLKFHNLIKRFIQSDIIVHGNKLYDVYAFINKYSINRDVRDLFISIMVRYKEKRSHRLIFDNDILEDQFVAL